MEKGNLTREQAISEAGEDAVKAVEAKNCEPTNRVGYNGACQGDALCEWSAGVQVGDAVLTVYYYTNNKDDEAMAAQDGDGSAIDWEIAGYEIA